MPILAVVKNPFGVVQTGAILWFANVTATLRVMGSTQASRAQDVKKISSEGDDNLISSAFPHGRHGGGSAA
jgi:1,4-dihydroxy-2-naphthoyl-CoA hydrolase